MLRDGRKVGTFPRSRDRRPPARRADDRREHRAHADGAAARRAAAACSRCRQASRAGEFEDVSLTLRAGEIVGLIGLLGAGRTELALALFGMTRLDGGEIARRWRAGSRLGSNRAAIAAGIAYVSEDRLVARHQPAPVDRRQYRDHRPRPPARPPRPGRRPSGGTPLAQHWIDRAEHSAPAASRRRRRRSPAATSSASCWRSGSRPGRRC